MTQMLEYITCLKRFYEIYNGVDIVHKFDSDVTLYEVLKKMDKSTKYV